MGKPILQNVFDKRDDLLKEWCQVDTVIIHRLTYIFKKLAQLGDATFSEWYVTGAPTDSWGDIDSLFVRNKIVTSRVRFTGLEGPFTNPFMIRLKGKDLNVRQNIPVRWMFEHFEKELTSARLSYTDKENRKSIMALNAKEAARSKLSPQEIRILGL